MTEGNKQITEETIKAELVRLSVLAATCGDNRELQEQIAAELEGLGIDQEDLLEWMGWGRRNDSIEYVEDLANRHLGC